MSELKLEQKYVDLCYKHLNRLTIFIKEQLSKVNSNQFEFSDQAKGERDSLFSHFQSLYEQYSLSQYRLVFGKLIYDDSHSDNCHYIGRTGLHDDKGDVILVDWRAPIGSDFYGATYLDRRNISIRRHIQTKDGQVLNIEDEILTDNHSDNSVINENLTGEAAILYAMNQNRSDHMNDIVSTIQKEQDQIIRSSFDGVKVIQGGAGTGKTAVALHRIAYLLYTYRKFLANESVLFVGPSDKFLSYVDRVLPSLGETGTISSTIDNVSEYYAIIKSEQNDIKHCDDDLKEIKGSINMSKVIMNAVNSYISVPKNDIRIRLHDLWIILERQEITQSIKKAQKTDSMTHKGHNYSHDDFVEAMILKVATKFFNKYQKSAVDLKLTDLQYDLKKDEKFRKLLNHIWLPLEPISFIKRLFNNRKRLEFAAKNLLTDEQINQISKCGDELTYEDLPLIEEADFWIGQNKSEIILQRRRNKDLYEQEKKYAQEVLDSVTYESAEYVTAKMLVDTMSTVNLDANDFKKFYYHIVVDEAQELSQMQFLMLKRKSVNNSFTIVGDLAQRSNSSGIKDWKNDLQNPLYEIFDNIEYYKLSTNYRNPSHVSILANEVAKQNGLNILETKSVRNVDNCVTVKQTDDFYRDIDEYCNSFPEGEKTAVITSDNIEDNKGLEFDNVIVAEPKQFNSISSLYVALTRATKRLVVLYRDDLLKGFDQAFLYE